jgi:hypothetical protein
VDLHSKVVMNLWINILSEQSESRGITSPDCFQRFFLLASRRICISLTIANFGSKNSVFLNVIFRIATSEL